MPSFSLDPKDLQQGVPKPVLPHFKYAEPGADRYDMPTCSNCREGNCNRCPTAITVHGVTGWTSDFECRHYYDDQRAHAALVEADNAEFERSSRGGWSGGDYRPDTGDGWTKW